MSNIACYIRVSTDKADQQKSLQQQRVLLENQYKDRNVLMYSDTGTGTSFKRTGFKRLMYDAGLNEKKLGDGRITFEADLERQPLFDEIVVINTSRFARNIAVIDILRVLWNYKKVNVKFLDVQKDSSNINDMILLQMFFAMAEQEVKETSVRTKRGNNISIIQNRIRNNFIFGWDFERETNSLIKNDKEAEAVRFIYNTALTNGLKMTAKLTNEAGYRTKKGNLWTDSTIKTLITNPKYKGYNVRNKFENVNLFTESKTKYVKKEDWIVQYNERIDPLVSEELWEEVQLALFNRCSNGNRGKNASKYDTSGKVKCSKCGATYTRSVETRVADKPLNQHYMICSHKKKYTKTYCSSDNITIKMLDDFIDEQRKLYYVNIKTAIQIKLIHLQGQLEAINESNRNEKNSDFIVKSKKINDLKNKMTNLLDNFMSENNSEAMQDLISKKLQRIDIEIKQLESELSIIRLDNLDRETKAKKLLIQINKLKVDMENVPKNELSREEWLSKVNKIIVLAKGKFDVEYNLE